MKIDEVEYPDHVVAAFCDVYDEPFSFFLDESMPQWYRQLMVGHLESFNCGWKAREERKKEDNIGTTSISEELHSELEAWLQDLKACGGHPTVDELQIMVTKAGIVKRTLQQIQVCLDYEKSS